MKKITTARQAEANRANAAHSTGPKTEEGKRIASHNALKTGLTGRTVLLPTDDIALYQSHLDSVTARYQPTTDEERLHAQTIAHIEWRLLRIPTLETGLLALGRKRLADRHTEEPAATRAVLIEAEVLLEFQKPLANLALQETRLNRQHEREVAKLKALQSSRLTEESRHLGEITQLYLHCQAKGEPFPINDLRQFGFVFTTEQLHRRLAQLLSLKDHTHWPSVRAHYHFHQLQSAA